MKKIFLKEATVLSVYDFYQHEKILFGKVIFGICVKDEINRFEPDERVVTSLIQSQNNLEFITKNEGNCYVTDNEPEHLELRLSELVVMRHLLLSPNEILEARETLETREKIEREDTK
tara:strand:- start:2027 stop:2380 length:354 start_codon:yes stop_codon:yes gene_type:complete